MKISKTGIDLIKGFERFISRPYRDAVGISTIGWGFTYYPDGKRVTMKDPSITIEQADLIFTQIFEKDFAKYLPENVNQNQFDALGSLIYNIGVGNFLKSSLLKKVKANPNDPTIKESFLVWNKATKDGKLIILNGLTIRRNKEAELYFKPISA
jgi:lysozyme